MGIAGVRSTEQSAFMPGDVCVSRLVGLLQKLRQAAVQIEKFTSTDVQIFDGLITTKRAIAKQSFYPAIALYL